MRAEDRRLVQHVFGPFAVTQRRPHRNTVRAFHAELTQVYQLAVARGASVVQAFHGRIAVPGTTRWQAQTCLRWAALQRRNPLVTTGYVTFTTCDVPVQ